MCGRFTLTTPSLTLLANELDALFSADHVDMYRRRYNIAPTHAHWLLRMTEDRRSIVPATWGIPSARALLINARIETAAKKPAFRESFLTRRCVIPADGFFEWTGSARDRRPFWFHLGPENLLLFAGLFNGGPSGLAFTILTTSAVEPISAIHERMPVILARGAIDSWLTKGKHAEESRTLTATEVSPRVNYTRFDDAECLLPPMRLI